MTGRQGSGLRVVEGGMTGELGSGTGSEFPFLSDGGVEDEQEGEGREEARSGGAAMGRGEDFNKDVAPNA